MAAGAGVPVLLDAHGEALRLGAAAGPAIVKPNLAELELFAGRPLCGPAGTGPAGTWPAEAGPACPDRRAVAAAAGELRAAGPQAVVVSLGAALYADTAGGCWRAVPPAVAAGNATGAGDAAAAGLAQGLALGEPWPERLRHAAALGTAAALAPVAGEFNPADYATVLAGVTVSRAEPREAGPARAEAG